MRNFSLVFCFTCLIFSALTAQDFYSIDKIHEIKITFKNDNWDTALHRMKEADKGERLVADVAINGKIYAGCGVRYKGNSSYFNTRKYEKTKLPFNIKASEVVKTQRFDGDIETLKLSNVFRDPSYLREVLAYEIATKYMPAPRANFVKLYVNNEYMGLYNNTESVDEDFLEANFGNDNGTLVKCDPAWKGTPKEGCAKGDKASLMYLGDDPECYYTLYEMKEGKLPGWKELIELTKILNEKPEELNKHLNVDQALWMLAFNDVTVNLDSYTGRLSHNYYLYKNTATGQFEPLVWDMNLAFGGFRFAADKGLTNEDMATLSPFVHYKTKNAKRPLIVQLLNIPLYRKLYVGHINTILQENFANDEYIKYCDKVRRLIDNEVRNDNNKLYSYEEFQKNYKETAQAGRSKIVGIQELMKPRVAYLKKHALLSGDNPVITKVVHEVFAEQGLVVSAHATNSEKVYLMYRKDKNEAFKQIELFDDGGHNDQSGGDKYYANTIPSDDIKQYYIIAEGERLAQTSPARASFEFHKVK